MKSCESGLPECQFRIPRADCKRFGATAHRDFLAVAETRFIQHFLKDLFSQDEVGIRLSNESGELRVPEEPVADYLDYIEQGEGSWRITTEGVHGGKKKHSSSDNTDTVEITALSETPIEDERQLELETGRPAPGRKLTDARMVAEVLAATVRLRER